MRQNSKAIDRRQFLFTSSAVAASALFSNALSAQVTAPKAKIPSADTVLKFNPNGTPKIFKGNTVICHLPAQCKLRDEMIAIHEELLHSPYIHMLGPTPTDSYHMTVFPGANDQDRKASGWPSYVPIAASIEECNQMVGERMAKAKFNCSVPLRVRLDVEATLARKTAAGFTLSAIDTAEEKKMRDFRDQISEVYGFRLSDHDTYRFHMTLSYQMGLMTDREWASYQEMFVRHVKHIAETLPVIELGTPEYCTFDDMFRFEPRQLLRCS